MGTDMITNNLEHVKVSVIVTIYNIEEYLRRCVDSILNQTHRNLEIILVDDGSTDSSPVICDQYAQTDRRIKVLHKDNGGPASARQVGLEVATGQYIGFVDGDDYIEAEMYGWLLEQLVEWGADFIHSGFYKDKGKVQSHVCNFENGIYDVRDKKLEFIINHILTDKNEYMHPSMCTKLFKAKLIKESHRAVPADMSYGEDLINLVSSIFNADAIATCGKSFYHYVFREGSIMNGTSQKLEREFRLNHELSLFFTERGLINDVKKYLQCTFYNQILEALKSLDNKYLCVSQYCIKDTRDIQNKKIVIYGAGNVGMDFYQQLSRDETCHVVAIVDKNFSNIRIDYIMIRDVNDLLTLDYDLILVAVKYSSVADKIKEALAELGVDKKKIIWKCPDSVFDAES